MSDVVSLALRALAGGVFVVAFSLIAEVVKPKTFSGLFSAAPSVALAGLLVAALGKGTHDASESSLGMVVGAVAMFAYCVVAALVMPRLSALVGSLLTWSVWLAIAICLGLLVL